MTTGAKNIFYTHNVYVYVWLRVNAADIHDMHRGVPVGQSRGGMQDCNRCISFKIQVVVLSNATKSGFGGRCG